MPVTILEALDLIATHTQALSTQTVPIEEALGRVCAKTLYAHIALPTFNNSAMDGFALCGHHDSYAIVGKLLAGDGHSYTLNDAECVAIMTGAEVPSSATAVIPQENTQVSPDTIAIQKPVAQDANIRHKGEDIQEGEIVTSKGQEISSAHIALLASQGITHMEVYRVPRIGVFASGSELKLHFETLGKSQVYNSNTPYLMARSQELGCESLFIGKAEDSVEALQTLIRSSLDCDLIVTSGGVSVGEADFTKEAFSGLGCESIFSKVAIKPGKPTTFGKIGNTLILNLPGNPLASTLNFEIFGKVIIMILRGLGACHHGSIRTTMGKSFTMFRPVDTVIPGFFDGESFTPAHKYAPGNVNVLNHCNGMIIVDKETKVLEIGDKVRFMPIRWEFLKEEFEVFTS